MFRKLAPYMKKYRLFMLLSPLMMVGEVLLEVSIPMLMSRIVDEGIPSQDMALVLRLGGLMALMAVASLLCGALGSVFSSKASIGVGSEIRAGVFNKVQSFSFANTDHFSTASLVTRMTTDINNTQNALIMVLRTLARAPVMLVSATIMAFRINASLVTVFLVAIPVLAAVLAAIAMTAYPRFQAMLKKYDRLNASVQENLIAIRVVKAFVREPHEKQKFKDANDSLMQASLKAERVIILNSPMMQLTMYACILAILWFGGHKIVAGSMMTGQLISFISYVTQILMSLMMLSMIFVNLVISRASVSRILEVLDEPLDITDSGKATEMADGSIEFRDVCFKYNPDQAEDVLSHINLKIGAGQTVGILGGTGSAKTTLVQLIPRLYDVTSGALLVGGHDVRDYDLPTLRNNVAMVLQKNVLFSGTIRDNLRWGNADATDGEIEAACQAAQAHDFIMSFPDGYDTDLGQGGVNVSGGQKQRLCIARALLKRPKVLILDDSTSAVDTATDAQIRAALARESAGMTTLIIAQRASSVEHADVILVMDEGRIAAMGTHEQLLQSSDIYREVYESQQKGVA